MLRFIVFAALFYVLSLVVSNLIRWYKEWKIRQGQPQGNSPSRTKSQVEYKNVTDAKFKDLPQQEHKEHQTENNS